MNCIFNYNERHEITSVIIPKTVDNVDFLIQKPNDKFNKLKKIIVDKENPSYTSINGILYNKNKTNLYKCPPDINLENIKIPYSINEIKEFAFSGCNKIKSLKLPNSSTIYGGCSKTINPMIDFYEFKDCSSLKTLIIPNIINIKNIHYLNNLQTIKIFGGDIFHLLNQIISDFNKAELKQRLIIDLPENLFIEVIDKIDHDFMINKIEHDLIINYKKYHIISSEANRDLDIELIKNISGKTFELKSDLSSEDLSEETSKDLSEETFENKSKLIQKTSKDSSKETSENKLELIQNSSKETSKDSSEVKSELIQMKVQLNTNCFQILFYIFFGIILTYIFG